jgi:ComEC/Rec2-related protein
MITRNRIVLFCYFYIVGLSVAMVFPLDPSALSWLNVVAGAALGATVLYAVLLGRRPGGARHLGWLLCASALALGYARYIAANTEPDALVGEVRLGADRSFHLRAQLPDTARLRWHKDAAVEKDVRLRVTGELDARVPVVDARGAARLDARGRWQFNLVRRAITSEVVVVRAGDPVGTDYVIPQPLTRITGVELVEGPAEGRVSLHRISNHIGTFSRPGRGGSPVKILGRISADPLVYDFKTVLPITPQYIQYPAGGPYYRVEGGDIHVTVKPGIDGYDDFAQTAAYGWDVQVEGALTVARGAANPGGFDARRFMQNYNIFGLMNLFQPPEAAPPIRAIPAGDTGLRKGTGLVEFSLDLRDRVLRVIKLTMPYPQSAFLGGVTLGLRYGLPATPCLLNAEMRKQDGWGRAPEGELGCEELVVDEFKAAGVNHVLAVSGLHVTIITVMFVGIFVLLRLPKQVYVPFIFLALVVFAIITGARPSTLRAVIMNSLFLLTWAYLHQGLRSSALLGVPVAAFLILVHNPLVVVDPSFTLSFGAILSLVLLTGPFQDLLSRLRGNQFVVFVVLVVALTAVGMRHWALVVTPSFVAVFGLMAVTMMGLAGYLQRQGIGIPTSFGYSSIPSGFGTFLAAQFGIQVGMMIPLSAYYFCRWPFAGAYANLIAIPLIGIVVQLAAIGGLLGTIPVVGLWIALLLNAANWFSSSLFMWIAHVSAKYYPYPFVTRPSLAWITVYYLLCAVFIWHKPLWRWWRAQWARLGITSMRATGALAACALGILALPVWLEPPRHEVGQLRVSFLSVGYGSAVLIESPGGRNILVDCGMVEHERGRRNEAIRTVLPILSTRGIRQLDALILSSPLPERVAGASFVLDHAGVDYLFVPPTLTSLDGELGIDQFAARTGWDPQEMRARLAYHELVVNPDARHRPSLAKSLARRGGSFVNRWSGWDTRLRTLTAGTTLFEEEGPGGRFRIEVLHPPASSNLPLPAENESLVLRVVYGTFSLLLTGDLQEEGIQALLRSQAAESLRAQVLVIPHHGTSLPDDMRQGLKAAVLAMDDRSLGGLLDVVQPETAILEFGNPRPVAGEGGRDVRNAHEITRQFLSDRLGEEKILSTDVDMAITVTSDGATWDVETQAQRNRAFGGEDEAVSDIAVGL